jgi:hypothetical protein
LTLVLVSTQLRAHCVRPVGHALTQAPLLHTCEGEHAVPHAPQWFALPARSSQTPLQFVDPAHSVVQLPLLHA